MKILVLPGDGIGKEVTAQAVKVLKRRRRQQRALELTEAPIGGAGVDAAGDPLPPATLDLARKADAILFGAAGVPGDEAIPYEMRPGAGLLRLRKELDLFANFRPVVPVPRAGRRLDAEAGGRRGARHADSARADRRPLFRRAARLPRHAERRARGLQHHASTRSPRSSASRTSRSARRAPAGARSAPSTRPTCSRRCSCGARW